MTEKPTTVIQVAEMPRPLYGFSRRSANDGTAPAPEAAVRQPQLQQQQQGHQTTGRGVSLSLSAAEEHALRARQQSQCGRDDFGL